MLKKNRIIYLMLSAALCMGAMTGCGKKTADRTEESQAEEKKSVVCTIFPEYDWAKQIIGAAGDQYELTLLLDNGSDLHSYQPTAEDIAKIADCDVFVYVGGESDTWVADVLKERTDSKMQVVNLLEVLGNTVKEEETVEGMEAEEPSGEDEVEAPEYDEHVWLSLKNAETLVKAMTEALKKADEKNADVFQSNCDAYVQKLENLNQGYESAVSGGTKGTLVFGDRFPFRYMTDDYNLDYYAAFAGCSAETEASFGTIVFLAEKVDELGLSHVLVIENSDQKIAQTVINNTADKNQGILVLDSMQSTTGDDIAAGKTYLSAMQNNLGVLKTALE